MGCQYVLMNTEVYGYGVYTLRDLLVAEAEKNTRKMRTHFAGLQFCNLGLPSANCGHIPATWV